jgi:hypothetical protein
MVRCARFNGFNETINEQQPIYCGLTVALLGRNLIKDNYVINCYHLVIFGA